ncbi:MAG: hypothetical protein JWO79_3189, partial [Actinomycetia bacterium]|nr:hypothetical protein [Actinomycetes bacterium]
MTNRSLRRLGAAVLGLAVLAVTAAPATVHTAGAGSPAVPAAHTGAAVPAPTA